MWNTDSTETGSLLRASQENRGNGTETISSRVEDVDGGDDGRAN